MSFTLSTGNVVVASAGAAIVSQTDTTATIRVTVNAYITDGWVYSTGVGAHITINGSTETRTVFGNGVAYYYAYEGTKTATYDVTVNKTTASQNISWKAELYQYTDGHQGSLKQTNSGTVAVKAKTSYSVTYNANGGTGAPGAQTKWYGTALTLSSTKPTRTGYTFSKWNTNKSGTGTNYNPGASYSGNAALILYAIWTANKYTITYNANGGTGAPTAQTKTYGVDLTLSSTKPTRTNYNFVGWATSSTASTAAYSAGGTFKTNAATTLYAVWELAYTVPTITSYSASRCTSDGTLDDFGTYVLVKFDWACCQITGANAVTAITVGYRVYGSGEAYTTTEVDASGTSGSVSVVIGGGNISTDSVYEIQASVTDTLKSSNSGKFTRVIQVPMAQFIMDFKKGGTGIAIGKPAKLDNTFEVAKKTIFTGGGDAAVATTSSGMVIIGDPGGLHLAFDNNEIIAKNNGTTSGQLNVQTDGGSTSFGGEVTFYKPAYFNDIGVFSKTLSVVGTMYPNGGMVLPNAKSLYGTHTNGGWRTLATLDANDNTYFGLGSRSNSDGYTCYDGNTVYIRSNDFVYIQSPSTTGSSARAYGQNKILWTGGHYMTSDHTATLSEAVTAQPNGIVLAWSAYVDHAAQDHSWAYTFVPKAHVQNKPGTSLFCSMNALGGGVMAAKCVYVGDTYVTGHDNNVLTGTDCSVNYYNNFYVLRYVIGV